MFGEGGEGAPNGAARFVERPPLLPLSFVLFAPSWFMPTAWIRFSRLHAEETSRKGRKGRKGEKRKRTVATEVSLTVQ